MSKIVPADGPLESPLLIVGEAPGPVEEHVGKPFRGPSGDMLTRWLRSIGVNRWDVRCNNVIHYRPPGNQIEAAPPEDIIQGIHNLRASISDMPNLKCIVTLGNYATFALTGRGKVKESIRSIDPPPNQGFVYDAEKQAGISVLRGSRYYYSPSVQIIPTIHPAFYLRGSLHREKLSIYDFRKVGKILNGTAPPDLSHNIFIEPSEAQLHELLSDPGDIVSCDIETPGNRLTCIGFGTKRGAYVIPFGTKTQRKVFYPIVERILSSPDIAKVFHNNTFDLFWLSDHFSVRGPVFDTMHMHHCVDAVCPHALHVVSSIYLWQPYWKAEAKDAEEELSAFGDLNTLHHYNGLDCNVTYALFPILKALLPSWEFYVRHYSDLTFPVMRMMRHGIRRDIDMADEWSIRLEEEINTLRNELTEMAGEDLWAKKDLSSKKLQTYFYETLALPKKYKLRKSKEKGKSRSLTTDEAALIELALRHPGKAAPAVERILRIRGNVKQQQFLTSALDRDGRLRSTFSPTADTGRFRSSKNPKRTGANLENQDNRIKPTLIPDPDCILIEIDLSQAEHRIVLMLTGSPRLREVANIHPSLFDAHKENAAVIFKVPVDQVTKEQRTLGKRVVHASERGMKGRLLSDILLKDTGKIYDVKYCQRLIDTYFEGVPEVRSGYFKRVEEWIKQAPHKIINPWGRVVDFSLLPMWGDAGHETFKAGYAFRPQGDVADLVNQLGLIPLDDLVIRERLRTRLHIQNHDSLVFSSPLEEAYEVTQFLCRNLETPIDYDGHPLSIPTEVAIGIRWDKAVEWKKFPEREEFDERATELLKGDVKQ